MFKNVNETLPLKKLHFSGSSTSHPLLDGFSNPLYIPSPKFIDIVRRNYSLIIECVYLRQRSGVLHPLSVVLWYHAQTRAYSASESHMASCLLG